MDSSVTVALIAAVAALLSAVGATWLTRRLMSAQVDDLVTKRLTGELERVYERLDKSDAQADVYRHNNGLLLDHLEVLEQLVPPPPPPRPVLRTVPTNH